MKTAYTHKSIADPTGRKTTYLEWEGGPQKILLLHGFPESPYIWEPIAKALQAAGFTVIAPYLLGFEQVDTLDRVITMKELAEWLHAFVDSVLTEEKEKVFLVGHDFGAVTGYVALALPNHRFSQYVALAIPPLRSYLLSVLTHPIIALRRRYIVLYSLPLGLGKKLLARNNFALLKKITLKWCEGAERSTRYFSSNEAYALLPDLKGPLALYRGIGPSFSKLFPWLRQFPIAFSKIKVPTRIFVGADETTYPPAVFDGFSKQFDPSVPVSLHVIPQCGHFIPLDAPEWVVEHVLDMQKAHQKSMENTV